MSEFRNRLGETEKFYLQGMQQGWAAGNDGEPVDHFPGWRQVAYTDNRNFQGFLLVDRWGRDEDSGRASGSTTITHFGVLVWAMWYGRESYEPEAIPLLRKMLMQGFESGQFHGGRGPKLCYEDDLVYRNDFKGDFCKFSGNDFIRDNRKDKRLGLHDYWGGSLMYLGLP